MKNVLNSLKNWGMSLWGALAALVDVRSWLLIGGAALIAWVFLPASALPLLTTAGQLTVAFIFAVGISHLIRKILLSGDFDLGAYAKKALESALASALVFMAVLAFVGFLINSIVQAILK